MPKTLLIFVLLSLPEGLPGQSGPPVFVYSANNSADYGTTLAQGSLFVVFGNNLGPASLTEVSSFPLPNALGGTSVTVTSAATTLNCPMIYTSSGQVAAILPSDTPPGTARIAVSYTGGTSDPGFSSTQITVAASTLGIFTLTSSGQGVGIFTALDGSVKTFANSAKPGELVTAWTTGLGPIPTADNVLPTSYPNFPNVQVWVGGEAAQIVYDGRSGCCSAVDQIAFTVPAGISGCDVPVTIVSGGIASNAVALPVNAAGGACINSGPTVPTSILSKATAGQAAKVAYIAIGPASLVGAPGDPRALAQRLSAILRMTVTEADAAKLIRAYRSKNQRTIRRAMAKYASRWNALDTKTRAGLIANISLTQQSVVAEFGNISNEATLANVASSLFPPAGACVVLPSVGFPSGFASAGAGLDAGTSLLLTGAAGSYTLKQTSKGAYEATLGASATGPNIPTGAYTISSTGGADVGAFSATVTVASHLAISNKSSLASVDETMPLTVTWTGGVAGHYMLIGGGYTAPPHSYFICAEDAGKGTFTVPSYILSSVGTTTSASGILFLSANPLSSPLTIPGTDAAYFIDASSDSVNVAFGKLTLPGGTNVANVTGSIDGLYPASGAAAAGGNRTSGPVSYSALLTAATFTTAFDILPGASSFVVSATSAGGSATISINPTQNSWQATYVAPTAAARAGDFSNDNFTVTDFSNGSTFPGNLVPVSRMDSLAISAANALVFPTAATPGSPNGTWTASGTLPPNGHFVVGTGSNPPPNFGGFTNLTTRGQQSASFSLFVDGKLVASKQVAFSTE